MPVTFFVNSAGSFASAVAGAGHASVGTETFEQSNLAPGQIALFDDPLAPGVANANFATGTSTTAGVTVQANANGNNPATVALGGTGSLATASAGYVGTPDDQVSCNLQNHSFDMLFDPPGSAPVKAVAFVPLYFDFASVQLTDTLTIRVYNTSNVLIGTQTIVGGNYQTEASHIGIIATGGDSIGRVNINDSSDADDSAGADDIQVYTAETTPPTVTITVADTFLRAGETSTVTFAFSEAVTGLGLGDLTVSNGSLSAPATSDGGLTWTATLTPFAATEDTTNVVTLDMTGVADLNGNAGVGTTNSNNYVVDTVDDPTVAVDDAFSTDEATAIGAGLNVFNANPTTADSDEEGDFVVTAVNGSAAAVGTQVTLLSGALLTLNADGTFSYDPNGAFEELPAPFATSGASNLTDTDSFQYTVQGGDTATVTVTITGVDNNDVLVGTAGGDTLSAGIGNDTLEGRAGDDTLNGGSDNDTAIYVQAAAAVAVSLALQGVQQNTLGDGLDTLIGIENLWGSQNSDTLTGDGNANVIEGDAGDDTINGGGGNDTASYANASGAVTVSLLLTTAQNTGGAGIDTLASMENLTGSAFADTLNGNSGDNIISGGAGNDTIRGRGGTDTFFGDSGADFIVGDAGDDTITGGTEIDRLYGGSGNDTIFGGAGADTLAGGPGIDRIDGGDGADRLYADATADTFVFGGVAGLGDRVFNFLTGVHTLEVNAAGFGGVAGLFDFAASADPFASGAPGAAQAFLYDSNDGYLYFDADGAGAGAPVYVLKLDLAPALAATDIDLV